VSSLWAEKVRLQLEVVIEGNEAEAARMVDELNSVRAELNEVSADLSERLERAYPGYDCSIDLTARPACALNERPGQTTMIWFLIFSAAAAVVATVWIWRALINQAWMLPWSGRGLWFTPFFLGESLAVGIPPFVFRQVYLRRIDRAELPHGWFRDMDWGLPYLQCVCIAAALAALMAQPRVSAARADRTLAIFWGYLLAIGAVVACFTTSPSWSLLVFIGVAGATVTWSLFPTRSGLRIRSYVSMLGIVFVSWILSTLARWADESGGGQRGNVVFLNVGAVLVLLVFLALSRRFEAAARRRLLFPIPRRTLYALIKS
jgi:hypothetical protein